MEVEGISNSLELADSVGVADSAEVAGVADKSYGRKYR